ncbi:MAG: hypothetical protein Q4E91_08380 [Lachnospiraceae bacterium]|nr:hypothetical protein [Lachnospiraceae bacterium]
MKKKKVSAIIATEVKDMDRTERKNRWLCIVLIMGVLLTGICYVCMEAESVRIAMDTSDGKLISDFFTQAAFAQKEHVNSEEVSGLTLFSQGIETEEREQRTEDAQARLLFFFWLAVLPILSHCNAKNNWNLMEVSKQKQNILISYIHQKDGSKRK